MRRAGGRRLALVLAPVLTALLLALAGCSGVPETPINGGDVDVDTAKLREMKADAGIEACRPGEADGGELPDVTLPCLGGGDDVDLQSLRGPMVINLWWSGCQPCRQEMPALQEFYEKHGDVVTVLGIDYQDNYPEAAIALADDTGATYPQLADPLGDLGATDLLRGAGLPQFVFVDADGEITGHAAGGVDSLDQVVDLVTKNLDVDLGGFG